MSDEIRTVPVEVSENPGFVLYGAEYMKRVVQFEAEKAELPWIVMQDQIHAIIDNMFAKDLMLVRVCGDNAPLARKLLMGLKGIEVFVRLKGAGCAPAPPPVAPSGPGPKPVIQ